MKEKVLVTGGAGYVGSSLVPKLLNENYDVRVLDSMLFGSQGLDQVKDNCEIINGDIRDAYTVRNALKGIDSVIHLAAISNDPCSDLDPNLTQQVNYYAVLELVNESKKANVGRFIAASSSSVYGIKDELEVTEELSLEPLTQYSQLKAESEKVLLSEESSDFVPVVIRPATVCGYSPRQRLDVIVNILTSDAVNKGEINVFGGEQKRPNIHIDDMVDSYLCLLSAPKEKVSGQIFNYGGKNYTVNEIADIVKGVVGDHVNVVKTPNTSDPRSYSISSKKIKNVLGISPKKDVREAALDLKHAFEEQLITNPNDKNYRNIERMRELSSI